MKNMVEAVNNITSLSLIYPVIPVVPVFISEAYTNVISLAASVDGNKLMNSVLTQVLFKLSL